MPSAWLTKTDLDYCASKDTHAPRYTCGIPAFVEATLSPLQHLLFVTRDARGLDAYMYANALMTPYKTGSDGQGFPLYHLRLTVIIGDRHYRRLALIKTNALVSILRFLEGRQA
jgi:hypothetical protein